MAGERRAEEQFLLNKEQALAQDVERVLSTYEGEPIPDEVVQWAAKQAPRVAQALLVKTPEGGFTRRLSAAERQAQEDRAFARRKRAVEEPLLGEQERILNTPDVTTLPIQDRKLAAKLRGLDEDAYLTPAEKLAEARATAGYQIAQLQMNAYTASRGTLTEEQKRLYNKDAFNVWKSVVEINKKTRENFNKTLQQVLDDEPNYGSGQRGQGPVAFNRWKRTAAAVQAEQLRLKNLALEKLGMPASTDSNWKLNLTDPTLDDFMVGVGLSTKVNPRAGVDANKFNKNVQSLGSQWLPTGIPGVSVSQN
jgi:hypothetical protein